MVWTQNKAFKPYQNGSNKPAVKQTQWNKQPQGKSQGKGAGNARTDLPAGFKVNENARYKGTVTNYWKLNGYGFVTLKQQGVAPDDKVFVLWQDITSSDRFPHLVTGMEVELSMKISTWNEKRSLRAHNVTLVGGAPIEIQDETDAEKKEFVGGQFLRYTGNLKFYKSKEGYGYIDIDEGFVLDSTVPKQLRCEMAEMNAGGKKPGNMKEVTQVEFGIWKTTKGAHKAYNVTLPGGNDLPAWESRQG